jgi:hypothetical protein
MRLKGKLAVGAAGVCLLAALTAPAGNAQADSGTAPAVSRTKAGDGDVYVVRPNADGSTRTDIYTPAAGVSADQLRTTLRMQGISGVQPQQNVVASPADGRCAPFVGTAAAWCDHKWAYGPFNDPQVYYIDFTGNSWPVTDAQVDWYQAPGIDAYYRYHTAGCPGGGRHCVNVREGSYGTAWYGHTASTVSGGYFVDGSVTVELNNQVTPNDYTHRRSVACHEMGHAIGMAHNNSTNSCMSIPEFPQHPSSQDYSVLNQYYPKPGT